MKEFKEEKRELEIKIAEMIGKFCNKYDIEFEDIDFNKIMNFDGYTRYIVSLKFDI